MSSNSLNSVIGQVMRMVRQGTPGVTDGHLLERFLAHRDEAAFETLVWRHGPMVWRTCRRILGRSHDVEDAFQATFLILSRKAKSVASAESLGCWLHQVAYRACLKAKARAARLPTVDLPAIESAETDVSSVAHWRDLRPILDDELSYLPEKYRAPLVLHYLEGKTTEQTAAELRWPIGTVAGRMSRARELLRKRLARRGVALSTTALSAVLTEHAAAGMVTGMLVSSTVQAVGSFTAGVGVSLGAASMKAVALAEGVLQAMMMTKVKVAALLLLTVGLVGSGAGVVTLRAMASKEGEPPVAEGKQVPREPKKTQELAKRVDLYGDPLPEGATARLGSTRFRHPRGFDTFSLSPDGKTVATISAFDRTIRIWDLATGKELKQLTGHEEPKRNPQPKSWFDTHDVTYSSDSKTLASCGPDKTIRIWDAESGKERLKLLGHTSEVRSVAFSPKGDHVASSGADGTIRVWHLATAKEVQQITGHGGDIPCVVFSPDGKRLASCGRNLNASVRLWDLATGKQLYEFAGDFNGRPIVFSPDGRLLAVGSQNLLEKCVHLWDVQTGKEVRQLPNDKSIFHFAFSPDGKTMVGPTWDSPMELCFWDVENGTLLRKTSLEGRGVTQVAFSADGQLIAGAADNAILFWDPVSGRQIHEQEGHKGFVRSMVFVPDGKSLISAGDDNTIRQWDLKTLREVRRFEGHSNSMPVIALSADGKILAAGGFGKAIHLWDAGTGKELVQLKGHTQCTACLDFSPDGNLLAAGQMDGTVRLWEVATGKLLFILGKRKQDGAFVYEVAFAPDGKTLAVSATLSQSDALAGRVTEPAIHLWDVANGEDKLQLKRAVGDHGLAFLGDGKTLIASNLGSIQTWNCSTGEQIQQIANASGRIAISPDSSILALADFDGSLRLWNLATGKEIRRFDGHRGIIGSLSFSPDGKTLATGGADTTIVLWDLKASK